MSAPTYTFNLDSTDATQKRVALVRNEIDDVTATESPTQGADYFRSDQQILASLASAQEEAPDDATEVEVRLMACGAILDTLATNQAYVLKKSRTLGEEMDGPAVGKEIRSHASALRARANASLKARRDAAAEEAANGRQYKPARTGGFKVVPRL